jgi:hypothetical protein
MRKSRKSPSSLTLTILLILITYSITSSLTVFSSTAFSQDTNTLIKKDQDLSFDTNTTQGVIPSAESVYQNQSVVLPPSVKLFVWYIVNEAHEDSITEYQKYVSDHNPLYLPTNIVISQGTAISFLDADAPWDTPHPHSINIQDSSGNVVYTTGKLDYTNASVPKVLPTGKYSVTDAKYNWMKGTITVSPNQNPTGNLVVGGFYTPTHQVVDNKDNDGGAHPGWLGYYKTEFPNNGFKILSLFDFHYATCKYCPGEFWPDQKTADHTLLIYSTEQSTEQALAKLTKMVWNNVYI